MRLPRSRIVQTQTNFQSILAEVEPEFYSGFPTAVQIIFGSGISSAAIVAVLLNLLFNHFTKGTPASPSVFAAGTGRVITYKQIKHLRDGDYVKDGKLHTADGEVRSEERRVGKECRTGRCYVHQKNKKR